MIVNNGTFYMFVSDNPDPFIICESSDANIISASWPFFVLNNKNKRMVYSIRDTLGDLTKDIINSTTGVRSVNHYGEYLSIQTINKLILIKLDIDKYVEFPITGSYSVTCYDNGCILVYKASVYVSHNQDKLLSEFKLLNIPLPDDNIISYYSGWFYYTHKGCPCKFKQSDLSHEFVDIHFSGSKSKILKNVPSIHGHYYALPDGNRHTYVNEAGEQVIKDVTKSLIDENVLFCVKNQPEIYYINRKPIACIIPPATNNIIIG